MFQPFAELTNRTPSPSQHDEDGRPARKHSPWTAARQKKKTRSIQSSLLAESHTIVDPICSPGALVKEGGCCSDIEPEYSLADGLSPAASSSTASPHCSPPLQREEDADVHPTKAYIVDQQDPCPDLLTKFTKAASAAGPRSPMWFGSSALQDELADAASGDHHSELQHSTSAPSNVLFYRFDALPNHQHDSSQVTQAVEHPCERQQAAAVGPSRRRGVARRRSWTGSDVRRSVVVGSLSGGSIGISRLAASSHATSGQCHEFVFGAACLTSAAAATAGASLEEEFQLHSRIGLADRHTMYGDVQRLPWDDLNDEQQHQHDLDMEFSLPALDQLLSKAAPDTVDWYEEKLLEAAEQSDLATAQQLWSCMQASNIVPTRRVINNYLMCCYYAGCDPLQAEEAVRQMCIAADVEPDALTARLLASIDISWQQLQCGC